MADWIKMRTSIFTDPRVFRLVDHWDTSPFLPYCPETDAATDSVTRASHLVTVACLMRFWMAVYDHGHTSGESDFFCGNMAISDIDRIVGLEGFGDALRHTGWIEIEDGGIFLPNFLKHNEFAATQRQAMTGAERTRKWRERQKCDENVTKCDAVTIEERRGDKKREEKEKTPLPPVLDTEEFRAALNAWKTYKGRAYKPRGLQSLISQAAKRAEEHGVETVVNAFEVAMSNGWAGWNQGSSFEDNGRAATPKKPSAQDLLSKLHALDERKASDEQDRI